MVKTIEKLVPDTSVIIEGIISKKLKNKEIKVDEVIIHEAVLAELEHQANQGKPIGFMGLDEIKRIRELATTFELSFKGIKPDIGKIRKASLGDIDSLIRELAYDEDATLITSDKVQYEVALAKGVKVIYIEPKLVTKKLRFEQFFDDDTMSVHLRSNVVPYAKKGKPGQWMFIKLREKELTSKEIQSIAREIIEHAKLREDGFIEIERAGSSIIQLGIYRVVITRPPFSDGWEITAVRPIKTLTLDDYKLTDKLKKRIAEQAEGILIAGSPGMGKTTFARALAEYYASKNKIVKTVEAPRDLILPEKITQYALSYGSSEEIHDILLLSRPDYTIFDEMRNTEDFKLFADLRLAGVGMVGVVHATSPIDAIQRFIGRIEMGVIPQVIDTVVFIKDGNVNKILSLEMTVKVPSGMTEADLARPVVVVKDFETNKLEYEIYSYGEQTVVVPVQTKTFTGIHKLAVDALKKEFLKFVRDIEVEILSDNNVRVYVPRSAIPRIIGKNGKRISTLENKLGIKIDIEELQSQLKEVPYELSQKKNSLIFSLGSKMKNKDVNIYIEDEFVVSVKVGSSGNIRIRAANEVGKKLVRALRLGKKIKVVG